MIVDFMIGEPNYLGKGIAAPTLIEFSEFFPENVSTLLIDPESENKKAIHVYQKMGFKKVNTFRPAKGYFAGREHFLMKLSLK